MVFAQYFAVILYCTGDGEVRHANVHLSIPLKEQAPKRFYTWLPYQKSLFLKHRCVTTCARGAAKALDSACVCLVKTRLTQGCRRRHRPSRLGGNIPPARTINCTKNGKSARPIPAIEATH